MKRDYYLNDYEAISKLPIGQYTVDTPDYISLNEDGFHYLLSDIVIYENDETTVVPTSAYLLTKDEYYTTKESTSDGSGKTVYFKLEITNSDYAGMDLYISGNNFGTYTSNEVLSDIIDPVEKVSLENNRTLYISNMIARRASDDAIWVDMLWPGIPKQGTSITITSPSSTLKVIDGSGAQADITSGTIITNFDIQGRYVSFVINKAGAFSTLIDTPLGIRASGTGLSFTITD